MILRPGTEVDVAAIVRVWLANHLFQDDRGAYVTTYAEHLLRRAQVQVAEIDDVVVGFAARVTVGAAECLSDLFIDPAFQGRGIGGALVAEIWQPEGECITFSSDHPAALPLYIRAGLRPWWPMLYMHGSASKLPQVDGLTCAPASARAAIDSELDLTGVDRTLAYEFWTSSAIHGEAFLVNHKRGVAAVGISADNPDRHGRKLVRLVIDGSADPTGTVTSALAWLAREEPTRLAIPGPNPATRRLLASGFVIDASDTYMATRQDLVDPARFLPDPALL